MRKGPLTKTQNLGAAKDQMLKQPHKDENFYPVKATIKSVALFCSLRINHKDAYNPFTYSLNFCIK